MSVLTSCRQVVAWGSHSPGGLPAAAGTLLQWWHLRVLRPASLLRCSATQEQMQCWGKKGLGGAEEKKDSGETQHSERINKNCKVLVIKV